MARPNVETMAAMIDNSARLSLGNRHAPGSSPAPRGAAKSKAYRRLYSGSIRYAAARLKRAISSHRVD